MARTRKTLDADQVHRLYEALANVSAATPRLSQSALVAVWRRRAWRLPDTPQHCWWRGRLYRALPDTVKDDWNWILKILPDPGAADVFSQWGRDIGRFRATST